MTTPTNRGGLIVLSGPSGAGKGTLRKRLFARFPDLVFSISCTTRSPRPGECDGKDYRFVSEEQFLAYRDAGAFLEWAEVHGHFYGTLRHDVERELAEGHSVVLEIDVQGARRVRDIFPDAFLIFIMPPSPEALEARLRRRGSEQAESFALRMENARREMAQVAFYDRMVINDDLEQAEERLADMVREFRPEIAGRRQR